MRHYYDYVQGLEPLKESDPLRRGTFLHKLLEHHYNPKLKVRATREAVEDAFDEHWRLLVERADEDPERLQDAEDEILMLRRIWIAHERFMAIHDVGWKVLAVEQEFEVPIPGLSETLGGVIDLIIEYKKATWIVEHKTGAQPINPAMLNLDSQFSDYFYAGYKILGKAPAGVIYDYIRTKPPSYPKINQDGTVSKAKCDTDKHTFIQTLKANNLSLDDYQDRINMLPDHLVSLRHPVSRTKAQLTTFLQELIECTSAMQLFTGKYRNDTRDCTWDCAFFDVCTAEYLGGNSDNARKANFRIRQKDEVHHGPRKGQTG